jgi:hypothetical protein
MNPSDLCTTAPEPNIDAVTFATADAESAASKIFDGVEAGMHASRLDTHLEHGLSISHLACLPAILVKRT